jgi:hypothetical protein
MNATLRFAIVFAAATTLSACHVIEPEGRTQRSTFTTPLVRQQVRANAEGWLAERALYLVTSSDPSFVRGEKQRPRSVGIGEQIDVLEVRLEAVPEGTEVEIRALTFVVTGTGRRDRADQVSPEALRDSNELARALMPLP